MNRDTTFPAPLSRLGWYGAIAGVIGVIGSLIGAVTSLGDFLHAYVFAFVFWVSLTLGCFGFVLMQNMARGSWGLPVLRMFEAGAKNLLLMFGAFLPLVFLAPKLYPWADLSKLNVDEVLQHRHWYMNTGGFFLRGLICFAIWWIFTARLTRSTRLQDENGSKQLEQNRANVAAPGFVIFVLTITLAFTDWVMSLNDHWYSTIYGAWWMISCGLLALPLMVLIVVRLKMARQEPYATVITPAVQRDFGMMMIMLCMVWAYFSLSQWLIIWSGNLPDEIDYYLNRFHGAYLYVGAALIFSQFFGPFVALLSNRTKREPTLLGMVAAWLLLVRFADIYWNLMPAFANERVTFNPWTLFPWLGIGGFWMFFFVDNLRKNALLPRYDARLQEVLTHA